MRPLLAAVAAAALTAAVLATTSSSHPQPPTWQPYYTHHWEAENLTNFPVCHPRGASITEPLTGPLPLYRRFRCRDWRQGWRVDFYTDGQRVRVIAVRNGRNAKLP